MAIVTITGQLLFDMLREKLMLPEPITGLTTDGEDDFKIKTGLKGIGDMQEAVLVYCRKPDGSISLAGVQPVHRGVGKNNGSGRI